jgi:hypothetical protein
LTITALAEYAMAQVRLRSIGADARSRLVFCTSEAMTADSTTSSRTSPTVLPGTTPQLVNRRRPWVMLRQAGVKFRAMSSAAKAPTSCTG